MKHFLLTILFLLLTISSSKAQFAGGSGTEEDPYQIASVDQLQAIGDSINLDKYFIQIADIDAGETADWNNGLGFKPIGGTFRRSFDGNGHVISNLVINRPDENRVGLFRYLTGDVLRVGLVNADITGNDIVGTIAGIYKGGVIHSSFATGKVSGREKVGGLVGFLGSTFGMGNEWIKNGLIISSYAHVNTFGNRLIGGIAGLQEVLFYTQMPAFTHSLWIWDTQINYTDHDSGKNDAHLHSMHEVYASGSISGEEWVGGLIGFSAMDPSASYYDTENPYASYWDTEKSSQEKGVSNRDVVGTKGLTTEQMTGQDAFIHMDKLDFKETWQLTESYPVLAWQDPENAVEPPEVPIISVTPEYLDFGVVETDTSKTMEVLLENKGTVTLKGEVVGLLVPFTEYYAFDMLRGQGSFSLEPDSSLIIELKFMPRDPFKHNGIWYISHNAPNEEPWLEFGIKGMGKETTFVEGSNVKPNSLVLHQNFPNPFNPSTQISFSVPNQIHILLEVYDVLGQKVMTLVNEEKNAGIHKVNFDASKLSSGIYIYRMQSESFNVSKQMLLLK